MALRTARWDSGTFYVAAKPTHARDSAEGDADLGVSFEAATTAPTGPSAKLRKLRIGLFDTYGGSMPSGWTRLIFENFEFPYEVVFPPDLDAGNLNAKFDVLVFNDSPMGGGGGGRGGGRGAGEGDAAAAGRGRSRPVDKPVVRVRDAEAEGPGSRRNRFRRSSRGGRAASRRDARQDPASSSRRAARSSASAARPTD